MPDADRDEVIHGFRIDVIVKHRSRVQAAAIVHTWLSDWFIEDLGKAEKGCGDGSLLFYRVDDAGAVDDGNTNICKASPG
jgi:hypothetical protein